MKIEHQTIGKSGSYQCLVIKAKKAEKYLEKAKEKEERDRREKEKDVEKKFKEKERKVQSISKNRMDEKRQRERSIYENDQKHYMQQRNMSLTRKKDDDDEVLKKLIEFDVKMNSHKLNKIKKIKDMTQFAERHSKAVSQKLEVIKSKRSEEEFDYTYLAK